MRYSERFYRETGSTTRWETFRVRVETTDLMVRARRNYAEQVRAQVVSLRRQLREHIEAYPDFLTSFSPLGQPAGAPRVAGMMYEASEQAGVGPMAAVAGAIAELVGRELAAVSEEVIVENGGDVWMLLTEPATVALFAGKYRFAGALGLRVKPETTPCGVCTSSAKIGPSTSLGKADAATCIATNAALADAVATGLGNRVQSEETIEDALAYALSVPGTSGALVVYRDRIGAQGAVELVDPRNGE